MCESQRCMINEAKKGSLTLVAAIDDLKKIRQNCVGGCVKAQERLDKVINLLQEALG